MGKGKGKVTGRNPSTGTLFMVTGCFLLLLVYIKLSHPDLINGTDYTYSEPVKMIPQSISTAVAPSPSSSPLSSSSMPLSGSDSSDPIIVVPSDASTGETSSASVPMCVCDATNGNSNNNNVNLLPMEALYSLDPIDGSGSGSPSPSDQQAASPSPPSLTLSSAVSSPNSLVPLSGSSAPSTLLIASPSPSSLPPVSPTPPPIIRRQLGGYGLLPPGSGSPPKRVFVITPTYTRPTQMADMVRLSQTLQLGHLKYGGIIFWVVVEDATQLSSQVGQLLQQSGLPHVHLLGPRPLTHLDKRSGRGVSNRIRALNWLREMYTNTEQEGVIYFADDDNTYDVRLFKEVLNTRKVSVWPVGLLAKYGVSSPIVDKDTGKVIGFHDPYLNRRRFAVDMAGFAVDLRLFLSKPKATMPYKVGYEEDLFIRSLGVKIKDLQLLADNCTRVMSWHTKTLAGPFPSPITLNRDKHLLLTNLPALYASILNLHPPTAMDHNVSDSSYSSPSSNHRT